MKLFVSALEYSANVHLCEVLREIVGRGESVELCGIFDEKMVGNLSLGLHSAEKNKSKKPNKSFCYFWLIPKVESLLPLNHHLPNNAESQNLNKNNSVRSTQTRPLRGAKNRNQASSSGKADFLLEAESRGSPLKNEKAAAFWEHNKKELGGAWRGVQPFLRKEKNSNENAESHNKGFNITGKSLCDTNSIAVMGFIDVLKKVKFFLDLRKKCLNLALTADKILLMDSSSFNIPLAKRIKKRDKTKQIIYYILPQVWAWKPWRAKAIEENCDRLAAILPFEVGFYKNKAKFVGHPLLDEIKTFRVGNSSLELHSADFANLGRFADFSPVSHPKFTKNHESQTENPSVVDSALAQNLGENLPIYCLSERSEESQKKNNRDSSPKAQNDNLRGIAESSLDSAELQNLNKNNSVRSTQTRPLRGAKNREQGRSSASADFLLEAESRGSPPKSEKVAAFWEHNKKELGGAGRGVQPFLRKESSENNSNEIAESALDSAVDCNADSTNFSLNSTLSKQDVNSSIFDEKSGLCSCERENRTKGSLTKRATNLPDLSQKDAEFTDIFSFMPGSRTSEIKRIFPIFAEVKDALKSRDKNAKFHLIIPQKFASQNLAQIYGDVSDFHISFDAHRSLFQSRFAFICSGTATLECALIGTPFVLGYKCRALEAFVARCFLNVKFIGLANILYEKISPNETFHTELIQGDLSAQNLLNALDSANENDFLQKSLALRKYLKCGSASAVAKMLYGL